jgi:ribosomal protein S18 acetylase RimI-like enzyme
MTIRIQAATKADVQPLVTLSHKTIVANYSPFLGDKAVAAYIESGAVDQYVVDSIGRCVVLVEDGAVAGFSVSKEDLIDLMMIDVDRHRRGLGTHLLRHVEDLLFDSYDELVLESFQDNAQANAFYGKNGWIEARVFLEEDSGIKKIEFHKSRIN